MYDRERLAALNFCREYLYLQGFITDAENDQVHSRIRKYQDKKRINISRAQLESVRLKYDDNAKDEDYD